MKIELSIDSDEFLDGIVATVLKDTYEMQREFIEQLEDIPEDEIQLHQLEDLGDARRIAKAASELYTYFTGKKL